MKVLLVNPNFPRTSRSRNHSENLPIGLLKIGAYHKKIGDNVELLDLSNPHHIGYSPDLIHITSLYSYYIEYVCDAVTYCRIHFPSTKIVVGGIFASLQPEKCKEITGADEIYVGEYTNEEPDYSLLNVDYQIIHTSRGCTRRCGYCGVYTIEPVFKAKKSIKDEITKKKIVFYDNNLLANPYIEDILRELIELKKEKKVKYVESQSGFDGRILRKNPDLAAMLKNAGFKNPKIAWDGGYGTLPKFKESIDILVNGGFKRDKISVFMLYNYETPYEELELKRVKCWEEGVQIIDCRYRPYDQLYDNYNGRKIQTKFDYYIHPAWSDNEVKQFRKNVRRMNICIRHHSPFHSRLIEKGKADKTLIETYKEMPFNEVKKILPDAWDPGEVVKVEKIIQKDLGEGYFG